MPDHIKDEADKIYKLSKEALYEKPGDASAEKKLLKEFQSLKPGEAKLLAAELNTALQLNWNVPNLELTLDEKGDPKELLIRQGGAPRGALNNYGTTASLLEKVNIKQKCAVRTLQFPQRTEHLSNANIEVFTIEDNK